MSEASTLLQAVNEVARVAGAVALSFFRQGISVERKGDGSPVTAADRGAEQAARDWIAARFPRDGILGEELGAINPDARRRWIVDPIDGTRSFVHGVPLWGTLVAVAEGEHVLAGAIACPAIDEAIAAAVGEGCWWNSARAHVSTVEDLSQATVLATDEQFRRTPQYAGPWAALAARAEMSRSWGDCYGYVLVATGRADVMADGIMSAWDSAPLLPIIAEAGGVFTDWSGRVTAFGGNAIATNALLAAEVRSILGATGNSATAP